jgi:ComF family protein
MLMDYLREGAAFFFPDICPFCETAEVETSHGVCPDCDRSLAWFTPPWCDGCGRPLDAGGESTALCGDCLVMPLPFRHAWSAMAYDPPVQKVISRLKYGRKPALARALGETFLRVVPEYVNPFQYHCLVAVPLHVRRLRWRGFNQALLLAETLSKRFSIPLGRHAVRRVRETQVQAGLDREARLANLTAAFQVVQPAAIKDQRILLIDDVMTTGMTLAACATALLEGGAEYVDVLTVARTLPGRAP